MASDPLHHTSCLCSIAQHPRVLLSLTTNKAGDLQQAPGFHHPNLHGGQQKRCKFWITIINTATNLLATSIKPHLEFGPSNHMCRKCLFAVVASTLLWACNSIWLRTDCICGNNTQRLSAMELRDSLSSCRVRETNFSTCSLLFCYLCDKPSATFTRGRQAQRESRERIPRTVTLQFGPVNLPIVTGTCPATLVCRRTLRPTTRLSVRSTISTGQSSCDDRGLRRDVAFIFPD